MSSLLPPLRLTGATTLRDGVMQDRTVAIAGGRISTGPYPAVDLSGYYILPGIVDIASNALIRNLDVLPPAAALRQARQDLAGAGVTTGWLRQVWGWLGPRERPEALREIAAHLKAPHMGPDLRLQLQVETMASAPSSDVIDLVTRENIDMVIFADRLSHRLAQAEMDPSAFATWARSQGADPADLLTKIRALFDQRRDIPRRLCRMAESFDARSICYGSLGDGDGETRETYSILGAKLCLAPASHAAASVAYAVGDPTILPAPMLQPQGPGGVNLRALVQKGRCQALCSDDFPGSLVHGAFDMADQGLCDFATAWGLISTGPAAIMRLPDRGTIDPGKRADLTIVDPHTRSVAATISGGRMIFGSGAVIARLLSSGAALDLAAE